MNKIPFRIGDTVTYEAFGGAEPRWVCGKDNKANHPITYWAVGKIIGIRLYGFTVCVKLPTGKSFFSLWPLPGTSDYSPDQWDREGFVRHVEVESMDSIEEIEEIEELKEAVEDAEETERTYWVRHFVGQLLTNPAFVMLAEKQIAETAKRVWDAVQKELENEEDI